VLRKHRQKYPHDRFQKILSLFRSQIEEANALKKALNRVQPTELVVKHAGSAAVNGVYKLEGKVDGFPRYVKREPDATYRVMRAKVKEEPLK
jgi:hypothetical protein